MKSNKFLKHFGVLALYVATGVVIPSSCRPAPNDGETDTYIENGQMWAYGQVALTWLEGPGTLMLERKSPDQSLDTNDGTIDREGSSKFQIFGALFASTTEMSGRRDVAYVDYHATENKLLAYAWSLDVSQRPGSPNRYDAYVVLRKSGQSKPGFKKILIGSSTFQSASQNGRIDLEPGIKLSLISEGVYQGQWAVHIPDARMTTPPNFSGFCSQKVSQMPGQMPSQNPMQKSTCRPLPPQVDLCKGTPTQAGCKPRTPVQHETPSQAPREVSGLAPVGEPADRVYEVIESSPSSGKIVFVSSSVPANAENNAEFCSQRFFAVARTEGEMINTSCVLKAAPAEVTEGRLTCAVTVEFDNPQTYLEKICNVTGLFSGSPEVGQTVQILRK